MVAEQDGFYIQKTTCQYLYMKFNISITMQPQIAQPGLVWTRVAHWHKLTAKLVTECQL